MVKENKSLATGRITGAIFMTRGNALALPRGIIHSATRAFFLIGVNYAEKISFDRTLG